MVMGADDPHLLPAAVREPPRHPLVVPDRALGGVLYARSARAWFLPAELSFLSPWCGIC